MGNCLLQMESFIIELLKKYYWRTLFLRVEFFHHPLLPRSLRSQISASKSNRMKNSREDITTTVTWRSQRLSSTTADCNPRLQWEENSSSSVRLDWHCGSKSYFLLVYKLKSAGFCGISSLAWILCNERQNFDRIRSILSLLSKFLMRSG